MKTEILLEIANEIEADPREFDIDRFAHCICGRLLLKHAPRDHAALERRKDTLGFANKGALLAGLTTIMAGREFADFQAATKLFNKREWPKKLRDAIISADTPAEAAGIAAQRVREFVKSEGRN